MRSYNSIRSRVVAIALVAGTLTGCSDLLSVENPGAIYPEDLNNPAYVTLLTNGVIGEYQNFIAYTTMYASAFTDEFRNHHVYFENRDIDMRRVSDVNGTYIIYVWNTMHRARFMADTVTTRLQAIMGDTASDNINVARVHAIGGHTYTWMGEQLCEVPLNLGPGNSPEQMFTMAMPRFDDAIAVATAARARGVALANDALIARADSIITFARIGAARAALNAGDMPAAVEYAAPVAAEYNGVADEGIVFWAYFLENTFNLPMWQAIATASGAGNRWLSVLHTPFDSIQDPRIPLEPKGVMNAEQRDEGGPLVPNSPSSYSTYDGTLLGAEISRSSAIRVASALEARYILAEAEGMNTANIDFVNERRSIGGKAPLVDPTPDEYMAALRTERSIDFFADGHRLGDLRRYDRLYPNRTDNVWQTGPYPGSTASETYGDQKCWPVPLSEREGNPNY